jgi:hypothetical protein
MMLPWPLEARAKSMYNPGKMLSAARSSRIASPLDGDIAVTMAASKGNHDRETGHAKKKDEKKNL